jgi:hypothetical protein
MGIVERRRLGRLGALPDRDARYFKRAYNDLLATVETVLAEGDPGIETPELARLREYRDQFEDQLDYWARAGLRERLAVTKS